MVENKKEKKNILIALALLLLLIAASYPIVKSISSFKYVIKGEDTITASNFTAKIYEEGYEEDAVILDHRSDVNSNRFKLHVSAEDLFFEEAVEDYFTRMYVENTGEVSQNVKFTYNIKPHSNASNDVALFNDTILFFNTEPVVTLNPGEKWNVLVGVKAKSSETGNENTGADNSKIGGVLDIDVIIDIEPK